MSCNLNELRDQQDASSFYTNNNIVKIVDE